MNFLFQKLVLDQKINDPCPTNVREIMKLANCYYSPLMAQFLVEPIFGARCNWSAILFYGVSLQLKKCIFEFVGTHSDRLGLYWPKLSLCLVLFGCCVPPNIVIVLAVLKFFFLIFAICNCIKFVLFLPTQPPIIPLLGRFLRGSQSVFMNTTLRTLADRWFSPVTWLVIILVLFNGPNKSSS